MTKPIVVAQLLVRNAQVEWSKEQRMREAHPSRAETPITSKLAILSRLADISTLVSASPYLVRLALSSLR